MFPNWRIKLREARVAYDAGRLDEAGDLLHRENLNEFMQGKQLSAKVAAGIVKRARDRVGAGETAAGWGDLMKAAELGGDEKTINAVRDELVTRGIDEAQSYLLAGDPHAALAQLAKLERRRPLSSSGRRLKEIAELADRAKQLAERGRFGEAADVLETAAALADSSDTMPLTTKKLVELCGRRRAELTKFNTSLRKWNNQLFQDVEAENWQEVLSTAEAILELAPKNTTAQSARRRAWKAIGMDVTQIHRPRPEASRGVYHGHPVILDRGRPKAVGSTSPGAASAKGDTVTEHQSGARWLLWIDGVGGYLVCHGDRVLLGQPSSQTEVDVPILADLSRHHAAIVRDGGSYVLEPLHTSGVDNRHVEGPTILADGQVITLGEGVRMRFRKPHVLSATARLDFESHHKTQPSADGVVLFADSCILGPKSHSHIPCRDWTDDVVLFRQGEKTFCRASGPFRIDGVDVVGQGTISPGSQVEGDEFSFSVEKVE